MGTSSFRTKIAKLLGFKTYHAAETAVLFATVCLSNSIAARASEIDLFSADGTGGEGKPFQFLCGMSAVTCASASRTANWVPCGNGPSDLAQNAYVVALIDTRDPIGVGAPLGSAGLGWKPAMWHNDTSATDAWNAKNLGEVFGITLDDGTPPDIYVTATSIYLGTGRGPGGHGGVYRLSGTTWNISLFHSFKDVGSVALGNICFDREHRQFFVSDLDHGLIRRLSTAGAEITSGGTPYDHGLIGRANVPLPTIADLSSASGDLTPSGRRVFGVQVFRSRLYYSVWYAPGTSGPVGYNEVWSVGLLPNGDLITSGTAGPRKELTLTGLAPFYQYPTSEPVVTDIAFAQDGRMLVGERSICTGDLTDLASGAHAARAVEYTFGTGWTQSAILNVGLNVAGTGRVNSAGGVDFDCAGHEFVTGDALINSNLTFPFTGNAVYGMEIYPTPTNVVDNSWVIDFDGADSIYDKLSIGDVEVYRCCDCLTFSEERVECLSSNKFQWSLCVTNTGTLTNGHLVFLDLPPGVTVDSPTIDLNPPLTPGQGFCTNVTFSLDPAAISTNQLCFRIAAHVPDYSECCVVSKCLDLPKCCALISNEQVKCDPGTPVVTWCFTLQNLSGVPVKYVYLIPQAPTCFSAAQTVITLNSPLAPNASTTLCVPINVTNSPCDHVCFQIALHDSNVVVCCAFEHCVPLRCGTADNHPPTVDCGPPVVLCDPKQAQPYVQQVTVQDPDGDPLTVIWKLDGTPVRTNTVAAGVSASPTTVSQVGNLSPGVHVLTVCVSDGHGAPTICEVKIEIGDHTPPTIHCPPDLTVAAWSYNLTNLTSSVTVSDNCTPPQQIKVTQDPGPGTVLPPGHHCITITATDLAGNTSTCTTCIDVKPVQIKVSGATPGILGVPTAVAPVDLTLSLDGSLSDTAGVEYFANGKSLGKGTGRNFQLLWPSVPAGSYSVFGIASSTSGATYQTDSVLVYVAPSANGTPTPGSKPFFSSVVLQNGQLELSMPTSNGVSCSVEVTDDLTKGVWSNLTDIVGDGTVKNVQVNVDAKVKFFRIRSAQ